jgi:hypothetical protein
MQCSKQAKTYVCFDFAICAGGATGHLVHILKPKEIAPPQRSTSWSTIHVNSNTHEQYFLVLWPLAFDPAAETIPANIQ